MELVTFFVQQIGGDVDRHLGMDCGSTVLHRFFLQDAQDVQCRGFDGADVPRAVATRAGDMARFAQRCLQALARQFQQSKTGDLPGLNARTVVAQSIAQTVFHIALIAGGFHVDEIDDDQAAKVSQAQLARNFVRRLQIGTGGGLLDVGPAGGPGRVHIDSHHGFRVIDHDCAA